MSAHKKFRLTPTNGRKTMPNQHFNQYETEHGGITEEVRDLISYTTRVASYNHTQNYFSVYNCQSNTTAIHINTFLEFYGFDKLNKKELLKLI
jgi:hypothetical protein